VQETLRIKVSTDAGDSSK